MDLVAVATTFAADGSQQREVVIIHSEDDWATAEVTIRTVAIPEKNPTTVAIRANNAYVIHANFNAMFAGQTAETFEIMRLDLDLTAYDMMDDDMGDKAMATEEPED